MTRDQMEAHLALQGWRAVRWRDAVSMDLVLITHPEAGFFFYDTGDGSAKAGAVFAEGMVERLPPVTWGAFDDYALRAIFSHLSAVGAI